MKYLLFVMWLVPAHLAAQTPERAVPVIVTTGEGVVKHAPDRAWVTIAAESRAKTAQDAQRMNSDAMTAVVARIKAAGVAADAIQTTGVNLQPEFDYANGRQTLRGYVARNSVEVRVDAIEKTGEIISSTVGVGATNVGNVRFDLKDRDTAERDALRRAVQDARRRADAAAAGASVQIERILRIEEERPPFDGLGPMLQRGVARVAEMAQVATPIEAGEIEVRARVTLTASIR